MKRISIAPAAPAFPKFGPEVVTEPVVKTEHEKFEERMAAQRREWKRQDEKRFIDETKREEDRNEWAVYAWAFDPRCDRRRPKGWVYVGSRKVKKNRRKMMTMGRLFAAIRQSFGIPSPVPVKLITVADDKARLARGEALARPMRFTGRVS